MIYTAFLHSCKRFMHHTGKKKVKERFKKKRNEKIRLRKICFKGIRTQTLKIS